MGMANTNEMKNQTKIKEKIKIKKMIAKLMKELPYDSREDRITEGVQMMTRLTLLQALTVRRQHD